MYERDEFKLKLRETLDSNLTISHPIFSELFSLEKPNWQLLKILSLEGYQITKYFLTYIETLFFKCPDAKHKTRLLHNLYEEETGKLSKTKNHVVLMEDFIKSQGIDVKERESYKPTKQTLELINYRLDAVQNDSTYHIGAAAVMIASEGQSLERKAGEARHTLFENVFGLTTKDTLFFSVHQKEDVGHVKEGIELVADICTTKDMQEEALYAVDHTCKLFWNMYDSAAQRYQTLTDKQPDEATLA
ncbi:MAG: iron-containing redox enzyme family protein [Pseudomonadales bacterium]|nr:iron-containing redox enzyme family protein [Pseudomonadales bacterium]